MKTRNKTIKDSETSSFLTNKIMKPCGNWLPTKVSKLWNSFSLLGVLFLFFNIPVHTLFDSQFYLFIYLFSHSIWTCVAIPTSEKSFFLIAKGY